MNTYVIVGGVAGGATAATRLRRRDEEAEIIVLERGQHVSFANCGLPYHIGGKIEEREDLLVATPQDLEQEYAIDVRTGQEALRIDREDKELLVRHVASGERYRQPYDKLILSTGAQPLVPPLPGVDLEGVFSLRTIPDMDAIEKHIKERAVERAVIVGGGFIGLEMAENLGEIGLAVTVVEMLPQVMSSLDYEMAAVIHRELDQRGIGLALGRALETVTPAKSRRLSVTLSEGDPIETDLVLLAIGVRPESTLAREAGLELGGKGHVIVNQYMQTSDPSIYAIGDVTQCTDPITGRPTCVPLAGPANRQARVAASHATGLMLDNPQPLGTAIAKVFDVTAASTGANSHTLKSSHISFLTSITHSYNHVSYYPGAKSQIIKLLYRPEDGQLLGAQVVGQGSVDRSIDILATALRAGMTVYDVEGLDLAYAPPFGAAKDPVNVAGHVAGNVLRGDTDLVTWKELAEGAAEDLEILDVRSKVEWQIGHLEGARHIPHDELRERLGELSKDKRWLIYCRQGRRAYLAERILKQHGYKVANVSGGWLIYELATSERDSDVTPSSSDGENAGTCAPVHQEAPTKEAPVTLDATGLQCPGPIMAVYRTMQDLDKGQELVVTASDPGFQRDVSAWAEQTGHTLLSLTSNAGEIVARLQKGRAPANNEAQPAVTVRGKTLIVFSAELDRALASFVIANGAAATGQPVTMFFTFWGLNVLRRKRPAPVHKNLLERMFGWMLPKGPDALKLSKLNMGGLGTAMMKSVMKAKNIQSLPELIAAAREAGVRLVACQMSMDMMGIKPEELIEGVEIGGVATYLNETDKVNATLFV